MNNSYFAKPFYPIWQPDKAPTGTLLYLPFTEGSGPIARDYANSYRGTIESTVTWGKYFHGPTLSFTGAGTGSVTIADPTGKLAGMPRLTFGAMYIAKGTGGSAAGRILTQNDISGYGLQISGGNLQAAIGSTTLIATGGAPLNTLTVSIVTYDGITIRLYINGVLAASTAKTGAVPASTIGVVVGNRASSSREFNGFISSVFIANRFFGDTEVQNFNDDWFSGYFSPTRSKSRAIITAATLSTPTPTPTTTYPASIMMPF